MRCLLLYRCARRRGPDPCGQGPAGLLFRLQPNPRAVARGSSGRGRRDDGAGGAYRDHLVAGGGLGALNQVGGPGRPSGRLGQAGVPYYYDLLCHAR